MNLPVILIIAISFACLGLALFLSALAFEQFKKIMVKTTYSIQKVTGDNETITTHFNIFFLETKGRVEKRINNAWGVGDDRHDLVAKRFKDQYDKEVAENEGKLKAVK